VVNLCCVATENLCRLLKNLNLYSLRELFLPLIALINTHFFAKNDYPQLVPLYGKDSKKKKAALFPWCLRALVANAQHPVDSFPQLRCGKLNMVLHHNYITGNAYPNT
jgi:hypothetical protein